MCALFHSCDGELELVNRCVYVQMLLLNHTTSLWINVRVFSQSDVYRFTLWGIRITLKTSRGPEEFMCVFFFNFLYTQMMQNDTQETYEDTMKSWGCSALVCWGFSSLTVKHVTYSIMIQKVRRKQHTCSSEEEKKYSSEMKRLAGGIKTRLIIAAYGVNGTAAKNTALFESHLAKQTCNWCK